MAVISSAQGIAGVLLLVLVACGPLIGAEIADEDQGENVIAIKADIVDVNKKRGPGPLQLTAETSVPPDARYTQWQQDDVEYTFARDFIVNLTFMSRIAGTQLVGKAYAKRWLEKPTEELAINFEAIEAETAYQLSVPFSLVENKAVGQLIVLTALTDQEGNVHSRQHVIWAGGMDLVRESETGRTAPQKPIQPEPQQQEVGDDEPGLQ